VVKRIFHLPDMHCPSCVMRVESIEDELAGILKASASYHKQQLIVEFDERRVTEEEILAALRSLGYQVLPR